jgi:ubiquinone/menaquinone biosynthesis C-methylase UbiE
MSTDSQFNEIAPYYDELMAAVPYRLWVGYILDILDRLDYHPKTILDVACGTGNVSELLSKEGFEVVGMDISPWMIEVAQTKKGGVDYHVQDIADLDLGRTFDLAVSLFDSLNYVTDPDQLARGIKRVAEHLVEGGIFIFDINTIYALSHHFFDQASLSDDHHPKYVWNSEYDPTTRICRIDMTFEVLDSGEKRQFHETHIQRGHTLEELTSMLVDASFEVVNVFHAYKFRRPTRRSDRVFYVARKL